MKPKDTIRKLRELTAVKGFFTPVDIQKVSGTTISYTYLLLSRMEKDGRVKRFGTGIYVLEGVDFDPTRIALSIYQPCYLSFDTVLFQNGILSQGGYTLTIASLRRSKELEIGGLKVQYISIPKKLFWGFNKDWVALPEKAFIDYCWLVKEGKRDPSLSTWYLNKLDQRVLNRAFQGSGLSGFQGFEEKVRGVLKGLEEMAGREDRYEYKVSRRR